MPRRTGGAPARSPKRPARRNWDLLDPAGRRRANLNYHLVDHAILRYHWTNLDLVAPGVWRSNQPTHGRLKALKAMGINTILNLRGAGHSAAHLFEVESCRALGLDLVSVSLRARLAPERDAVLAQISAPGAPFEMIALELKAVALSGAGRKEDAVTLIRQIQQKDGLTQTMRQRLAEHLITLGVDPEPETDSQTAPDSTLAAEVMPPATGG